MRTRTAVYSTIIPVVAEHTVSSVLPRNRGDVIELDAGLEKCERGVGVGQSGVPVELVKRFEPLDRIAFHACAQAVGE